MSKTEYVMYQEEMAKRIGNLHIFVDADACPAVRMAEKIAEKYAIPVALLCDTNHVLESDYSEVIVVGAGAYAPGEENAVWHVREEKEVRAKRRNPHL